MFITVSLRGYVMTFAAGFIAGAVSCASLAHAEGAIEEEYQCMPLEKVQAAMPGSTVKSVSRDQYHFLQGIYAMNPLTRPGLPPGDGALLIITDRTGVGEVVWTVGPLACAPMAAPKSLIDDLDIIMNGGGGL